MEPPSTEQPVPSPSTCVLDIREDFLELSNATNALVLSRLYVRLKTGPSRSSSTLVLQKAPRLWLTNMVLEGDGRVVRGVETDTESRLYMESAHSLIHLLIASAASVLHWAASSFLQAP